MIVTLVVAQVGLWIAPCESIALFGIGAGGEVVVGGTVPSSQLYHSSKHMTICVYHEFLEKTVIASVPI